MLRAGTIITKKKELLFLTECTAFRLAHAHFNEAQKHGKNEKMMSFLPF